MTVYLCGGINGLSNTECLDWRNRAKQSLVHKTLDPMRRDYRGVEELNVHAIVAEDIADIRSSDILLVNATKPSWGTAMEIVYAYNMGKMVVAFTDKSVSPWLRYHCQCFTSMDEAISFINLQ